MKYIIEKDPLPLGSLGGTPAKISSHEGKNLFTQGRVYKDDGNKFYTHGVPIVTIRDELSHGSNSKVTTLPGNHFQNVGNKHHNSGTYFKTVYTCKDYSQPGKGSMDNCFTYAIQTFGFKLEKVAKMKMSEIVKSVEWSIDEAVRNYFEPVTDHPEDGDLVIYQSQYSMYLSDGSYISAGSNTHAGIYRNTKSNGHSPNGGTVESKWGWIGNSYVFLHDVFCVPNSYGDIVKFYRLKSAELDSEKVALVLEDLPLTGDTIDLT